MKDISHYRNKLMQPQPKPTPLPVAEADGYVAFEARDRVARLQIRPANAPTYAAQYALLNAVAYDGPYGSNFVLLFGFLTVRVRGQNLQPLVAALEAGTAVFFQEFDPDRWPRPSDPDATLVEWVEIKGVVEVDVPVPKTAKGRPH